MYFKQVDILSGLDKGFIDRMMDIGTRSSFPAGTFLFKQGDSAEHFYILTKGHIKLSSGQGGQTVHTVNHGGEAFGWSSLTGSEMYTASAQCIEPVNLTMFHRDKLQPLLSEDTVSAFKFYKNLAATLGNRLVLSYELLSSFALADSTKTYGTGQAQEEIELV
jgi:CRP/FNR family transcriptional regulator, cyclic AMP receptor protein